jgi:hypothetical protein
MTGLFVTLAFVAAMLLMGFLFFNGDDWKRR